MKALVIGFLFNCFVLNTVGQVASSETIPEKPKATFVSNAIFQFDNRNERYFETRGRMNGLKLGIEFCKRVRSGFGFYSSNDFYYIPYTQLGDSIRRSARFNYVTFFTEVVLFRSFRWEISTIGALGGGDLRTATYDIKTGVPRFVGFTDFVDVGVRDLAVNTQFKFFPWLGLGVGLGYRQVHDLPDVNLREAFTVNYVDFKIKIFMGYAIKAIFSPEKIEAEKAYYDYRKEKRVTAIQNYLRNE